MLKTFAPTVLTFDAERSAIFRQLRDYQPVFYDEPTETYFLSRFDDVFAAATDPATFSSVTSDASSLLPILNHLDDPRHGELRRLVSKAFTPARVNALEEKIRQLAVDLLDKYLAGGGGDLISGFSGPFASTVIGRLIGIPEDRLESFRHLTDQLLILGQRGEEEATMAVAAQIYAGFDELLNLRREKSEDDLMSALTAVQRDGDLSDTELLGFCFLLVAGGNDTTANAIANGWCLLLEHPESMQELAEDRDLIPQTVEEILRLRPPAETHARCMMRDLELHGIVIPKNARVQVLWGAANLDDREFAQPEVFDIRRRIDRHLAFGRGSHFCLGASLARVETRIALNGLLDKCAHLELVEPPVRHPSPWAYS
ncbi:MAG TPA: cytochrome P450, partial [Mycobacterium sp.]|nr:cytochrome P450 [Mycobacterium sp.]